VTRRWDRNPAPGRSGYLQMWGGTRTIAGTLRIAFSHTQAWCGVMQDVIGARPLVVTGVCTVAGAVMPRVAVAATATTATASCLILCDFETRAPRTQPPRFALRVIEITLSPWSPRATNGWSTPSQPSIPTGFSTPARVRKTRALESEEVA
jgi:hypothetical protein